MNYQLRSIGPTLLTVAMGILVSCAAAQTTQPVAKLPADASLDVVLNALRDAGGGNLKDFVADVKLIEEDALAEDATSRLGRIWYQAREPGKERIRVDLPVKVMGNRKFDDQRIEYELADGWLWDRDYKRKTEVKRQVLRPGQKLDLFKLGEGPFPLPIGQDPAEVKRLFEVKKIEPAADDPKDTIHLQLVPTKDNAQFAKKIQRMDVWVSATDPFPVRIQTQEGRTNKIVELTLSGNGLGRNQGLADKDFELQKIGADWTQRTEPFAER